MLTPRRLEGAASMKLLLVDDHPMVRDGLKHLLRDLDPDLHVDEAGSCSEATGLAGGGDYDLILLDLRMPGLAGLNALAAVRETFPVSPVVVLSAEQDSRIVRQAIEKGAMGFIPKSSTSSVMLQALRLVLAHGVYLPPHALDAATSSPGEDLGQLADHVAIEGLTDRQMAVLRRVVQGKPNKVIARELAISEGTVKAHLSSVLRALKARNRTEVVFAAAKLGLRLV